MAVVSYNESKSSNNSLIVHGNEEELKRVAEFVNSMYGKVDNSDNNKDMVYRPNHYCSGKIETIDKIESVIDGLPAKKAAALANVLKYFDRAGLKDDAEQDLEKANNYAFRLVTGKWHENN